MSFRREPSFGKAIFDALQRGSGTPREFARETGVSELIVRSVLEALAHVGRADFDPGTGRYSAPARG